MVIAGGGGGGGGGEGEGGYDFIFILAMFGCISVFVCCCLFCYGSLCLCLSVCLSLFCRLIKILSVTRSQKHIAAKPRGYLSWWTYIFFSRMLQYTTSSKVQSTEILKSVSDIVKNLLKNKKIYIYKNIYIKKKKNHLIKPVCFNGKLNRKTFDCGSCSFNLLLTQEKFSLGMKVPLVTRVFYLFCW